MHKHALVTGGAGFAGAALCLALREQGCAARVTAFDNLKRRGSELNLARLRSGGVEFVHGDVRSLPDLLAITPEPDLIVECSAEPSAQAGYGSSPEYLVQTNLDGCFHCLELARRTRADFIFLSTSRVYPYRALNALPFEEDETRFRVTGPWTGGIAEEFPLDGARSLYGMTKLAAEYMVEEYADAYGFRYLIDRFGVLTGPHQMAKSDQGVIALWVAAHHYERKLAYIGFGGTGKQVRDFLHVDDFCELVVDQLRHFDRYSGARYNAGGGAQNSLSLCETTELCREVTGKEIEMGSAPETRPADVRVYITDHSRVSAVNGWQPKRDARRTLTDIHRWLIAGGDGLRSLLFPA
jgi:CDP-paratose 2-epimerase